MDQISNPKKSYPYFASLLRMHVPTRVPHHDRPPSRPEWSLDGYDRAGGCASRCLFLSQDRAERRSRITSHVNRSVWSTQPHHNGHLLA